MKWQISNNSQENNRKEDFLRELSLADIGLGINKYINGTEQRIQNANSRTCKSLLYGNGGISVQ